MFSDFTCKDLWHPKRAEEYATAIEANSNVPNRQPTGRLFVPGQAKPRASGSLQVCCRMWPGNRFKALVTLVNTRHLTTIQGLSFCLHEHFSDVLDIFWTHIFLYIFFRTRRRTFARIHLTPGLGPRLPLTATPSHVTQMEADGLLRVAISAEEAVFIGQCWSNLPGKK